MESAASIFDYPQEYETLCGLVQRYSPTGQEKTAVDWFVQRMANLGFSETFRDEAGNAVGMMGSGARQLVLLGHIDTVAGELPLRISDEVLHGRGAVDAKGPLAAFADAAARVGCVDGWQIIVIGAVEEEGESAGARYLVPRYHPDFAIIGEPSQWQRVTLGYKGSARAAIQVRQSMAHSAADTPGACGLAVQAWQRLLDWTENYNQEITRAFDRVTPVLRAMASGDDGFSAWARLEIGARLPLELPPEAFYDQLQELLRGLPVELECQGFAIPAYLAEKNSALVRAFLPAIRSQGGQPGFVLKTGTADINLAAPVWQCPALAYGPGDSSLDHTPEERISLAEYSLSVNVLEAAIRNITR